MKVLASLFRVVFSIIVLLAVACYLQSAPTISFGNFCLSIDAPRVVAMLSEINGVSVSLVIILLLGILSFTRILEAAWNMLFCAATLVLLVWGLYAIGGASIVLPNALYNNTAITQFCEGISTYEVPLTIAALIFIAGWLCASACGRVATTTIVSFGLWYGLTELFTYIVHQWGNSANPGMPDALHMVQSTPWIIAAVPGAFFLIYTLLMALFETFIGKDEKEEEEKPEDKTQPEEEPKPAEDQPDTPQEDTPPAQPAEKQEESEKESEAPATTEDKAEPAEDKAADDADQGEKTPAEKADAEEKPAEPTPAETAPTETAPTETAPAEPAPAEPAPAEPAPAEPAPVEIKPDETVETKP